MSGNVGNYWRGIRWIANAGNHAIRCYEGEISLHRGGDFLSKEEWQVMNSFDIQQRE